jgi:hypothetical protein
VTPLIELPVLSASAEVERPAGPRLPDGERDCLIRRAKALSWLSLGWMTIEGAVAITAAVLAGSIALLGFGLDSAIEALASMIVIWRFTGRRRLSDDAEARAQKLVAASFFLLAPYIAQDAIRTLIAGHHPANSPVGIALALSSIAVMPLLGRAKQRIANGSDPVRPLGRGPRTCSAPIWPPAYSPACSPTLRSGGGGSIR